MKIGIDVTAALGEPSGQRRYLESYLEALAQLDRENEYHLCAYFWRDFPGRAERAKFPKAANFKLHIRRVPQSLLLPPEHLGLRIQERLMAPLGLELYHGTSTGLPRFRNLASVLAAYHVDVNSDEPGLWNRFYFNNLFPSALRRADRVLAVSDYTRSVLIDHFALPPERVQTIYLGGAAPEFHPGGENEKPAALGVQGPYFLFVSWLSPRKNVLDLTEGFARLRRQLADPHKLVIVARKNDYFPVLLAACRRLGIEEHVVFLENLSTSQLRSLYQGATALVYPSLLEGFGLPILEAMACGTPVIAARASCLPEIGAEACLYFEPHDFDGLAATMRRVATDPELAKGLSALGLARAKHFTWERHARETLAAYRSVLESRPAS